MTGGTFRRRRFVVQHHSALDFAGRIVAGGATHILMGSAKREGSAYLVIEQRGFPLEGIVTLSAIGIDAIPRELPRVNVFVTALATCRR